MLQAHCAASDAVRLGLSLPRPCKETFLRAGLQAPQSSASDLGLELKAGCQIFGVTVERGSGVPSDSSAVRRAWDTHR